MNINKNIVAGETIPVLPKVNSLQALSRLKPKKGSEWNTIAFALNRDIIDKDGKVDDLYGMIFSLGSFDDQEKAENHAKNVISLTGHPGVIVAKYGCAVPLSSKFDPNNVVDVPVDLKGKMINLESSQYKHDKETFEKRVKQEKEMVQEAEDETDINHIEHFKRQCFLAIKNRANYQMHQKQAEEYWNSYKKRETNVREHFKTHPEHEQNWLSYFKEKLEERGEAQIYDGIESAYLELRNELLGLNNDVCNNDVCNNDVCNNDVCNNNIIENKHDDIIESKDINNDKINLINDDSKNIKSDKHDDIIESKDINNDKIDLKNDDNKIIKSDKNDDIIIESKDINNDKIDLKNDDSKNIKSDKNKKKKKKN